MALIEKTLFAENIDRYNVFVEDTNPNSRYFNITELPDTFTGGKNAFLIAGAPELVPDTLIKIEIKDAAGNIIYQEPGEGTLVTNINGEQFTTEYYEGVSKVVSVYVYPGTTAYGPCTITILGELSSYYDDNGLLSPIPLNWEGQYNVKWQKTINVNPTLANTTKIRFYKRPVADIKEILSPIYSIVGDTKIASTVTQSFADIKISNLETFAGDVKRVKVFRTSVGDISDYDMIQDILIESKELLTSYELSGSAVGNTGIFTSETLKNYWDTGSLDVYFTSSRVESGITLNGSGYFTYTSPLDIKSTNTYELNLDAFYSASTPSNLGIYLVDGSTTTNIGTLYGIEPTKNLLDTVIPFKLDNDIPSASLYFSQSQGQWHLGNISLKLSEDTAFSPDEVSFVTTMPSVLGNETFNFKFEFYDVNNNYVPVAVTQSVLFNGGNNNIGGTLTYISASASASAAELLVVSSSISGTMTVYSSSTDGTITVLSGSVSGSITTLSGSVSSSITSLSSSVSASSAIILSSSFAQVKSLADGRYSGSFIGDDVIYSPTIGGQQGYIKDLFTVGDTTSATINLDARTSTRKIYIGNGNYNNNDTAIYLDSSGQFSLKDKLSFDTSGNLSVNGSINVTGGNAATQTYANAVGTNAVSSGSAAATAAQTAAITQASAYVTSLANGGWTAGNGTFITATSISSPTIAGNAGYISGLFKVGTDGITLDGTNKKIFIGTGTYANTNTGFYVDSSGNFSLKDKLTWNGTTLTVAGTINASAGTFSGNITSTATISGGTISGGTISGGSIDIGSGKFTVANDGTLAATGANINGTITAQQGNIGGWGINSDGFAFNFTDTNGLARGVKINSARGAVELSTAGQVSVDINSNPFLTDLSSGTEVVSGFSFNVPAGTISGDGTPKYGNAYGNGFTLTAGTTYQFIHNTGYLASIGVSSYSYNSAQWGVLISQNSNPTVENSPIQLVGSGARSTPGNIQILQLSGNFGVSNSGTYYIRPFVRVYSYEEVYTDIDFSQRIQIDYQPVNGNLNDDYWLYGPSISRSTQKTEIVGGGIQVVKDIDTYFKVDRNAGETQDFVKASGANFRFEGTNNGNANTMYLERFSNIIMQAGGHSISMGGGDTYMGIYPKGGIRISPAAGSGNDSTNSYVQLEPGSGNYATVGGSTTLASSRILTGTGGPSDERLKTEIEELLDSSLEKINELKIKSFKFKENGREGDAIGDKRIGVIAQEVLNTSISYVVNQTWPEIDGDYNVDHFSILGHAIKAIQELSTKVNELEAKISGSI